MPTVDTTIQVNLAHQGKQGVFELSFLEWKGNEIEIDFKDGLYDNSGRIRIDGSTGRAAIEPELSYARRIRDPKEFEAYFESIIRDLCEELSLWMVTRIRRHGGVRRKVP